MPDLEPLRVDKIGDAVWALLEQGASLMASMLSFLLLGRHLGAAGYGGFVGLYALIGPFVAICQSGLVLMTMEHTAREHESADHVTRSYLSIILIYGSCLAPLMTAIALWSIGGLSVLTAALLVGTEFFLGTILQTSVALIQAVKGYSFAARIRISANLVKMLLVTGLAGLHSLTLGTYAIGQVFTVGAVTAFVLVRVGQMGVTIWPGRIQRSHVRSTLLYGVGIAASVAQNDSDKFVLNAAHFQADAGRYGAAYQILQIAMMPLNALASMTHLSFLRAREGSDVQIRRAVRLSLIALVYAVPAVIGLLTIAPWIGPILLTHEFAGIAVIVQLLAPVVILRGIGVYPMNGLMGLGRNDLRTKLLISNALLSLALYAALIPTYSWRGALVATLISESLLFISGWVALLLCERNRRREVIAQ